MPEICTRKLIIVSFMKSVSSKLFLSAVFSFLPLYISVQFMFTAPVENTRFVPELTLENVYKELIRQGIRQPNIVMKQVIAETRWLECKNCSMQFNNIFGFLTKQGYLRFEDWTASVAYYKKWQDAFYKGGDYYQFLTSIGYATAPNYIRLLKQIRLPDLT